MKKLDVLDHGYVRLIDHMGNDLSVVRSARVSYDADWRTGVDAGSDNKLIKYLWNNGHTTPFESVTFTFEIKAPVFVFRQWHRHRTWSFNELSARYRELPNECYVPKSGTIGIPHSKNKQQRENVATPQDEEIQKLLEASYYNSYRMYETLLNKNVPKELARCVLPLGIYSHMFATVNLLNLLKFINLRDHNHAQHEIRVYAQAMLELITDIVPVCVEAFHEKRG